MTSCHIKKLETPSVPHLVHIETTYRCNSRCVFCYNPNREAPFDKATLDRVVKSVYDSWVPHVYLIGGEPSLLGVKQLNEYIDLLSERSSVTIVTNGLLYLEGLSDRLACIGIPLHGDRVTHERHTAYKGGYDIATESFCKYVARGFDVRCIPVLTAWNCDQIYDIISTAKSLGAESVFVDRFEDGGLGNNRSKDLKPSLEQFRSALSQMIRARDELHISVGFGTAIPYCLDPRLVSEQMGANCGVGITFAAINPNGDVRICNQSNRVYGNVLLEPIESIWKRSSLNDFRDLSWVTPPCDTCPVLRECMCGCKVDASCDKAYCVDYAVRGRSVPEFPVQKSLPVRDISVNTPDIYRKLRVDPLTKLNEFHREKYLVTRYQTIRVNQTVVEVLREMIELHDFEELSIVNHFADKIEPSDLRRFLSELLLVQAVHEVKS